MALPENRPAVMAILKEIWPRVIGKIQEDIFCGCGDAHVGKAVATEIEPGGNRYPGQEVNFGCWSVLMSPLNKKEGNHEYHCGLDWFIPHEELKVIFAKHFTNIHTKYPYDLDISGMERVENKLPPAISIMDGPKVVIIAIEWGKSQKEANRYNRYWNKNPEPIINGSKQYMVLVEFITKLNGIIYQGGPSDREYEFESYWRTDLGKVLDELKTDSFKQFRVGPGNTLHNWKGDFFLNNDLMFLKNL